MFFTVLALLCSLNILPSLGNEEESILADISKVLSEEAERAGTELAEKWKKQESLDETSVNAFLDELAGATFKKLEPDVRRLALVKMADLKVEAAPEKTQVYKVTEVLTLSYLKELTLRKAHQLVPNDNFKGKINFSDKDEENNILTTMTRSLSAELGKPLTNKTEEEQDVQLQKVDGDIKSFVKLVAKPSVSASGEGVEARSMYGMNNAADIRSSYNVARQLSRQILRTYTFKTTKTYMTQTGKQESVSNSFSVENPEEVQPGPDGMRREQQGIAQMASGFLSNAQAGMQGSQFQGVQGSQFQGVQGSLGVGGYEDERVRLARNAQGYGASGLGYGTVGGSYGSSSRGAFGSSSSSSLSSASRQSGSYGSSSLGTGLMSNGLNNYATGGLSSGLGLGGSSIGVSGLGGSSLGVSGLGGSSLGVSGSLYGGSQYGSSNNGYSSSSSSSASSSRRQQSSGGYNTGSSYGSGGLYGGGSSVLGGGSSVLGGGSSILGGGSSVLGGSSGLMGGSSGLMGGSSSMYGSGSSMYGGGSSLYGPSRSNFKPVIGTGGSSQSGYSSGGYSSSSSSQSSSANQRASSSYSGSSGLYGNQAGVVPSTGLGFSSNVGLGGLSGQSSFSTGLGGSIGEMGSSVGGLGGSMGGLGGSMGGLGSSVGGLGGSIGGMGSSVGGLGGSIGGMGSSVGGLGGSMGGLGSSMGGLGGSSSSSYKYSGSNSQSSSAQSSKQGGYNSYSASSNNRF